MVGTKGVSEPQTLQAGFAFSWSVLFMLAFVFCLIGFLFYILRSAAQQRQEALSVK